VIQVPKNLIEAVQSSAMLVAVADVVLGQMRLEVCGKPS